MKYSRFVSLLFVALAIASCKKNQNDKGLDNSISRFEFGRSYGYCIGNGCITFFSLSDGKLTKTTSSASGTNMVTVPIADLSKINAANDLFKELPTSIKTMKRDTAYGCPDCYDQGATVVRIIRKDGTPETVRITFDNTLRDNPANLQPYILKIHEVFEQLMK